VETSGAVDFLDGVVFYQRDQQLWMRGLRGDARVVELGI